MTPLSLTVVLPCYNPVEGWADNIISCFGLIKKQIPGTRLILVNDGSKTLSTETIQAAFAGNPDIEVVSYTENQGKGYALRQGIGRADTELIIYTDVDFPYTNESFLKIYTALADGRTDVAIGIRGEEYYTHLPKARVRISKLLRWFIKKFLRIPTDDTQCGLKGMNRAGKAVFMQTTINRYLFDLEFVFLSARKKMAIKTVEVQLRPEVVLSRMNFKVLSQEFGNFLKIFLKSLFSL